MRVKAFEATTYGPSKTMDYNTETWERFKHRRFDKEEIIV